MRLPAKQRRSRFDSGPIVHFASVVQRMGVRLLSGTMSVRVRPGAPSSSDGEGERYFGPKETLADRSSDTTALLNGRAIRILSGADSSNLSMGTMLESQPVRVPASFAKRMVPKGMGIVFSALRQCGLGVLGCAPGFQPGGRSSILLARTNFAAFV